MTFLVSPSCGVGILCAAVPMPRRKSSGWVLPSAQDLEECDKARGVRARKDVSKRASTQWDPGDSQEHCTRPNRRSRIGCYNGFLGVHPLLGGMLDPR